MADLDLKAIRNSLVDIARQAGRMILDANYHQDFSTDTKINCTLSNPLLSLSLLTPAPAHYPQKAYTR